MGVPSETRAGVRVCARFRPQNKLEQKQRAVECVRVDAEGRSARLEAASRGGGGEPHTFTFDEVFGPSATQTEVYAATARPLVESALRGYNCTCLVYGQTGTGKTFSMEGVPGDAEFAGIIPRVMADVYSGIEHMQAELEFIVRVSYIEIYLEKIRDLLNPAANNLSVRESRERGVWVAGAKEVSCASADDMMGVMRVGGANRVISSTRMNSDSSRSHSVFIITIEQRNVATGSTRSGKLFLVDLAGSEKVGKTQAQGQTLKEAQHINKSLSALGGVMNALTSGQANAHVPYRDSKLTRLLQDSLGGNSETTLLVCASCSSYNADETLSTLRFGARAKHIKNKPTVNEERTVAEYKVLVANKDKRIAALEAQLLELRGEGGESDKPGAEAEQAHVQEFLAKIEQLEDEQASKAAEMTSLEERCAELETENKGLQQKSLELTTAASRNEDVVKKLAFVENELEAKVKQLADLSKLLEQRERKKASDSSSPASSQQPTISEDGELENGAEISDAIGSTTSQSLSSVDRPRADSAAQWENELLRQQVQAKSHEVELCTTRIRELSEQLVNCRNFYDREIDSLQERLREYDAHIRGFMEISEKEDKTAQLDSLQHKATMLKSVRGGGGGASTSLTAPLAATASQAAASQQQRPRIVSSATSPDGWSLDDEVFPIAPIDMESPVVKRLIASMPEKGREKLSKWLVFVLEGRDIRSNFHPEISIEGVNEEINRNMRRLIVPLLKNRHDLEVQSYVRTRFVKVSDLKITLVPKNKDTVHVEATPTYVVDEQVVGKVESSATAATAAASASDKLWAKDHLFFGPKGDVAGPSVLHGARVLVPGKDRFASEPVDLSASVSESKAVLDVASTGSGSGGSSGSGATSADSAAAAAAPLSGGLFGRMRSKTGVGAMFGDVKNLLTGRSQRNFVHEDTLCDGCGKSPIVGGRWKCNTCENFELCDTCYGAGLHGFEVSNDMCRRIEQMAVQKHRSLGEFPELFELFRRHICNDDVVQFRRIVEWLGDIVAGTHAAHINHKMIVKSGLHPEIRARLVAQLGALASVRTDIELKTEWFVEKTFEEEQEEEAEAAGNDSDGSAKSQGSADKAPASEPTPSSPMSPKVPEVRLETLRMYIADVSAAKPSEKPAAATPFSDLLHPSRQHSHSQQSSSAARSASTSSVSSAGAGSTARASNTSATSADAAAGSRPSPAADEAADEGEQPPIYNRKRVKSITHLHF